LPVSILAKYRPLYEAAQKNVRALEESQCAAGNKLAEVIVDASTFKKQTEEILEELAEVENQNEELKESLELVKEVQVEQHLENDELNQENKEIKGKYKKAKEQVKVRQGS